MKVVLWITSEEKLLKSNLATTEQERIGCLRPETNLDFDMSDAGWIRAGEADLENIKLTSPDIMLASAIGAIDAQERSLRVEHQRRLAELDDLRGRLLALPAPAGE